MKIKRYIYTVNIPFFKYQGTGNDFVMIDNRMGEFPLEDQQRIAAICDRRFGVGADGVIVLQNHNTADSSLAFNFNVQNVGVSCPTQTVNLDKTHCNWVQHKQ